jgi:uncharacterized repeat protein (TIGR01451 family)
MMIAVGAPRDDDRGTDSGSVYVYYLGALITAVTLESLTIPTPAVPGDGITVTWETSNASASDSILLEMKRDSVAPSLTDPDGISWYRFNDTEPNDGIASVIVPAGLTQGDDWRFYLRHNPSGAYDSTDFTFTILSQPSADLQVTLLATLQPFVAGDMADYLVTTTNYGPNAAQQVTSTIALPVDLTFIETSGCMEDPTGVPSCTLGTIQHGASSSYSVNVQVSPYATGALQSHACSTSTILDPDSSNNCATLTSPVLRQADLGVTGSYSPSPAVVTRPVIYTLNSSNFGPSSGSGIELVVTLPPELVYSGSVPAEACSELGGVITCILGDFPPSSASGVHIAVTATAAGSHTVTATVSGDENDPGPASNTVGIETTVLPLEIFADGFESGNFSAWSAVVP